MYEILRFLPYGVCVALPLSLFCFDWIHGRCLVKVSNPDNFWDSEVEVVFKKSASSRSTSSTTSTGGALLTAASTRSSAD